MLSSTLRVRGSASYNLCRDDFSVDCYSIELRSKALCKPCRPNIVVRKGMSTVRNKLQRTERAQVDITYQPAIKVPKPQTRISSSITSNSNSSYSVVSSTSPRKDNSAVTTNLACTKNSASARTTIKPAKNYHSPQSILPKSSPSYSADTLNSIVDNRGSPIVNGIVKSCSRTTPNILRKQVRRTPDKASSKPGDAGTLSSNQLQASSKPADTRTQASIKTQAIVLSKPPILTREMLEAAGISLKEGARVTLMPVTKIGSLKSKDTSATTNILSLGGSKLTCIQSGDVSSASAQSNAATPVSEAGRVMARGQSLLAHSRLGTDNKASPNDVVKSSPICRDESGSDVLRHDSISKEVNKTCEGHVRKEPHEVPNDGRMIGLTAIKTSSVDSAASAFRNDSGAKSAVTASNVTDRVEDLSPGNMAGFRKILPKLNFGRYEKTDTGIRTPRMKSVTTGGGTPDQSRNENNGKQPESADVPERKPIHSPNLECDEYVPKIAWNLDSSPDKKVGINMQYKNEMVEIKRRADMEKRINKKLDLVTHTAVRKTGKPENEENPMRRLFKGKYLNSDGRVNWEKVKECMLLADDNGQFDSDSSPTTKNNKWDVRRRNQEWLKVVCKVQPLASQAEKLWDEMMKTDKEISIESKFDCLSQPEPSGSSEISRMHSDSAISTTCGSELKPILSSDRFCDESKVYGSLGSVTVKEEVTDNSWDATSSVEQNDGAGSSFSTWKSLNPELRKRTVKPNRKKRKKGPVEIFIEHLEEVINDVVNGKDDGYSDATEGDNHYDCLPNLSPFYPALSEDEDKAFSNHLDDVISDVVNDANEGDIRSDCISTESMFEPESIDDDNLISKERERRAARPPLFDVLPKVIEKNQNKRKRSEAMKKPAVEVNDKVSNPTKVQSMSGSGRRSSNDDDSRRGFTKKYLFTVKNELVECTDLDTDGDPSMITPVKKELPWSEPMPAKNRRRSPRFAAQPVESVTEKPLEQFEPSNDTTWIKTEVMEPSECEDIREKPAIKLTIKKEWLRLPSEDEFERNSRRKHRKRRSLNRKHHKRKRARKDEDTSEHTALDCDDSSLPTTEPGESSLETKEDDNCSIMQTQDADNSYSSLQTETKDDDNFSEQTEIVTDVADTPSDVISPSQPTALNDSQSVSDLTSPSTEIVAQSPGMIACSSSLDMNPAHASSEDESGNTQSINEHHPGPSSMPSIISKWSEANTSTSGTDMKHETDLDKALSTSPLFMKTENAELFSDDSSSEEESKLVVSRILESRNLDSDDERDLKPTFFCSDMITDDNNDHDKPGFDQNSRLKFDQGDNLSFEEASQMLQQVGLLNQIPI